MSEDSKKSLHLMLDEDVIQKVRDYVAEMNCSVSAWIEQLALRELNSGDQPPTVVSLSQRVADLEQRFRELEARGGRGGGPPPSPPPAKPPTWVVNACRELSCRKCGERMAPRKNKTTGEYFAGCTNFPDCRSTVPLDEPVSLRADDDDPFGGDVPF